MDYNEFNMVNSGSGGGGSGSCLFIILFLLLAVGGGFIVGGMFGSLLGASGDGLMFFGILGIIVSIVYGYNQMTKK